MDIPQIKTIDDLIEFFQSLKDSEVNELVAQFKQQGIITNEADFLAGVQLIRKELE